MGAFDVDPWEVAKRHYERQMHLFMIRVMRHFNVTQLELPNYDIDASGVTDIQEMPESNATFYRIKGYFQTDAHGDIP